LSPCRPVGGQVRFKDSISRPDTATQTQQHLYTPLIAVTSRPISQCALIIVFTPPGNTVWNIGVPFLPTPPPPFSLWLPHRRSPLFSTAFTFFSKSSLSVASTARLRNARSRGRGGGKIDDPVCEPNNNKKTKEKFPLFSSEQPNQVIKNCLYSRCGAQRPKHDQRGSRQGQRQRPEN